METGETRLRPGSEIRRAAILRVDQEQMCPISRVTAKWTHAERESERSIVPSMPWQQNHGGGKGPYLVCGFVEGKRR